MLEQSASGLFSNTVELGTAAILLVMVAFSSIFLSTLLLKIIVKKIIVRNKQTSTTKSSFPGGRNSFFLTPHGFSSLSPFSHVTSAQAHRNWPSYLESECQQNCRDGGLGFVPVPVSHASVQRPATCSSRKLARSLRNLAISHQW